MTEPTERQVLYVMVAGAWLLVVGVLAVVAWRTGLSPLGWSVAFAVLWLAALGVGIRMWRRTGRVLLLSLGVFVVWVIGTLVTRSS